MLATAPPAPPQPHAFLKAKPVIGGKGAGGALSIPRDEKAFHALDVPAPAAKARREVKEALRISKTAQSWSASTAVDVKPCDKPRMQNFAFDPTRFDHNYRAERLPPPPAVDRDIFGRISGFAAPASASRTERDIFGRTVKYTHNVGTVLHGADALQRTQATREMPVHPALEAKPRWEVSTQASRAELAHRLAATTQAALGATARRTAALLLKAGYTTPLERQVDHMERLRETRTQLAAGDSRQQPLGGDSLGVPKGEAAGHLGLTLGKPSRTTSGATGSAGRGVGVVRKYAHEGTWGAWHAAGAAEAAMAWSCCGASDETARGCSLVSHHNPDRRCLDSM